MVKIQYNFFFQNFIFRRVIGKNVKKLQFLEKKRKKSENGITMSKNGQRTRNMVLSKHLKQR